ncbi:MAG: MFS transporter [Proteobacteria bacterium]|nr:MFS transporter [Pseudomonadota bacterium]HQR05073.1 MFS transporter [Rhodocyclaceae bacterium]
MSVPRTAEADPTAARYGRGYPWWVMGIVALGLIAAILPSSSFVVAIPALMAEFHVSQEDTHLIVTAFMVANTIAMLPSPWLIQRFGIRRCFIWTMMVLLATSVAGVFSPSYGFLIVVRMIQGAGTGTLMPLGSIVVMRMFHPTRQGHASGILGLAVTLAPAVAPALGGVIIDHAGWRLVSLMPIPFGLLAWAGAVRLLPKTASHEEGRFDATGMALLSLLTLGWLGAVSLSPLGGWARIMAIACAAAAVLSALAFLHHARRAPKPLIALDVLARHRVRMGAVVNFILGFGTYGSSFLVPVYLQAAQGMSATRAGAALMPSSFALAMSFPVAGFLLDWMSPRLVIILGMAMFCLTWALLGGLSAHLGYFGFIALVGASRIGHGFATTPMSQAALVDLHGGALGQASTVLNYVRQLGGVFGVAALAMFVEWRHAGLGGNAWALARAYDETFFLVAVVSALSLWAAWRLRD